MAKLHFFDLTINKGLTQPHLAIKLIRFGNDMVLEEANGRKGHQAAESANKWHEATHEREGRSGGRERVTHGVFYGLTLRHPM